MKNDQKSYETLLATERAYKALLQIKRLLDDGSDAGGIALYHPNKTISEIRGVINEAIFGEGDDPLGRNDYDKDLAKLDNKE